MLVPVDPLAAQGVFGDPGRGRESPDEAAGEGGGAHGPARLSREEAVGWAALAPRGNYRRLEKSRILKPVDDKPVWSVPCFFTAKEARGQGVTTALLNAAAAHAAKSGAEMLEGYPVETKGKKVPDAFVWWGLSGAFKKAGFKVAARRSKSRPIMRRAIR